MVSTLSSSSPTILLQHRVRTKYRWPPLQLNFWLFIMLVASSTVLGIFANFLSIQQQMHLGVPWYFPYWVTVGALSVFFILIMLYLISKRQLLPGIVILGSFMLFVLWIVGLILWGPAGSVNANCNLYVDANEQVGANQATLAWLQQRSICQSWVAGWSFELIGCIFLLWMIVMAYQVYKDDE
ncbi:hypothetical protein ACMFMG_005235 [Clarireedia jacksonii]